MPCNYFVFLETNNFGRLQASGQRLMSGSLSDVATLNLKCRLTQINKKGSDSTVRIGWLFSELHENQALTRTRTRTPYFFIGGVAKSETKLSL
eukprot:scaffold8882_cov51-Attheya_sp.AAC.7